MIFPGRRGFQPRTRERTRFQSTPTERGYIIFHPIGAILFSPGRRGLQPRTRERARFQSAPTEGGSIIFHPIGAILFAPVGAVSNRARVKGRASKARLPKGVLSFRTREARYDFPPGRRGFQPRTRERTRLQSAPTEGGSMIFHPIGAI